MSDLISRSEMIKTIEEHYINLTNDNVPRSIPDFYSEMQKLVYNQPTAFDTEKVVEQLESEKRYGSKYDSYYEENLYRGEMFENDVNNKTIDKAIDIVKKGGLA